jgi:hypothetical protein
MFPVWIYDGTEIDHYCSFEDSGSEWEKGVANYVHHPPGKIRGGALHLPGTRFCTRPFAICNKILEHPLLSLSRDSIFCLIPFASANPVLI